MVKKIVEDHGGSVVAEETSDARAPGVCSLTCHKTIGQVSKANAKSARLLYLRSQMSSTLIPSSTVANWNPLLTCPIPRPNAEPAEGSTETSFTNLA